MDMAVDTERNVAETFTFGRSDHVAVPKDQRPGEHGHFHTFLRTSGMKRGVEPIPYDGDATWPVNRWITGMVRLFQPLVKDLIRERDLAVDARHRSHPGDVYEDKGLEVTSQSPISVEKQITRLRALLAG
ncbi:MAG: hypothetical protein GDA49_05135 [Rhodospirillales bacterium]|nr:hypothetical protein [Rhodospirillales bacterium]